MTTWGADARYTRLVHEKGSTLLRLALMMTGNRHDAEDVVQDLLISVASAWPVVRPMAYLKRAVANRCVDVIRKRRDIPTENLPEVTWDEPGFLKFEETRRFYELLHELPTRQRQTLVLRYQFDLGDAAIAQVLGVTIATVRSQAQHGLRKLRMSETVTAGKDNR